MGAKGRQTSDAALHKGGQIVQGLLGEIGTLVTFQSQQAVDEEGNQYADILVILYLNALLLYTLYDGGSAGRGTRFCGGAGAKCPEKTSETAEKCLSCGNGF